MVMMCIVRDGESVILVKGGYVLFKDGSLYLLKDCKLEPGARLVLAISEPKKKSIPKRVYKPYVKSDTFLEVSDVSLADVYLEIEPVLMVNFNEDKRAEIAQPVEKKPQQSNISDIALPVVGVMLMYLLKKVSGLDKELKSGSCEIRHQEAVNRIASLEGKVLRKQIIDGAKFVKGQIDKRSERDGSDLETQNKDESS